MPLHPMPFIWPCHRWCSSSSTRLKWWWFLPPSPSSTFASAITTPTFAAASTFRCCRRSTRSRRSWCWPSAGCCRGSDPRRSWSCVEKSLKKSCHKFIKFVVLPKHEQLCRFHFSIISIQDSKDLSVFLETVVSKRIKLERPQKFLSNHNNSEDCPDNPLSANFWPIPVWTLDQLCSYKNWCNQDVSSFSLNKIWSANISVIFI